MKDGEEDFVTQESFVLSRWHLGQLSGRSRRLGVDVTFASSSIPSL